MQLNPDSRLNSRKYRILLLNTQMEEAGAQKALLSLARGLLDEGHDVQVVTMYDKANYVPLFSRRYALPIKSLEMKRTPSKSPIHKAGYALRGLWRLYRLMKSGRFDVLQTYGHYSNIIGPVVAWAAGIPVRVSSQRMSLRGAPKWLWQLDRIVANSPLIQKMVTVSEGTRQFCIQTERIRADKLLTIRNGVDIERYAMAGAHPDIREELGLERSATIITTVARLHRQKGHVYLIQAIPEILASVPDAHFLLVGEGDLQDKLETLVAQESLAKRVHFLGVRQDIPAILASSDLFVLPSLWEGLPNSILEAMAAGTPVVATLVDGCSELIEDGVTGLLVPPADARALSQAIVRLLLDAELRERMVGNARHKVETTFSGQSVVRHYLDLYTQLVCQSDSLDAR